MYRIAIQNFLLIRKFLKNFLRFQQSTEKGPKKCPVYLKLPWICENSLKFERKIKLSISNCFGAVQPRVVLSTRRILLAIHKDIFPTFQQSNVIYEYVLCHCDNRYVVQTSQRLQDIIRQRSKSIRNRTSQECKQPEHPGKLANSIPHCDSPIGNHLLHDQKCASYYKDNQFFILSKARSDFHLSVLESIFITLRKPNFSRQKEFFLKHKLLV